MPTRTLRRPLLLAALTATVAWAQTAPAPVTPAPACQARVVALPDDPQTQQLSAAQRGQLMTAFFNDVQSRYLDPSFGGFDWKTQAELTRRRALAAKSDALFYAELRNLVNRVGDGHFAFLSPKEAQLEDRQSRGEAAPYGGVGLSVAPGDGVLTVSQVFPGAPAEQAGILTGDVITGVDGQDCPSTDQIRGAVGTPVTLTLRRAGGAPRQVKLQRAQVSLPPVTVTAQRLAADPSVGYLRFDSFFRTGIAGAVQDKLKTLLQGPRLRALVIDLRLNGGGFVDEGERFLGNFVQGRQGTRVDRAGHEDPIVIRAGPLSAQLAGVRLALLVGPGTASMGEITGAILQQARSATVLGQGTAKLTSNYVPVDLPFGARVHLTDVDVFLLGGKRLGARGVVPDISRPLAASQPADQDPLVARALQALGARR